MARVRRSGGGDYLGDLKSDPRLEHTFPADSQTGWEAGKEEEKMEKVLKEENKVVHKSKRQKTWEANRRRKGEENLFQIHSFSNANANANANANLTNFPDPLPNTKQNS